MNYKNNNTFEPVAGAYAKYLESLGIRKCDIDSFLYKPRPWDYESPWDLKNMEVLVDALHKGFTQNKRFFLQVDSDTDGYTSAAAFIGYFSKLYPNVNIDYAIHEGKQHGVIVSRVPVYCDIVIIPDAGSNQIDEFEELGGMHKQVLVMDHHVINHPSNYNHVIIVNNQQEGYNNKSLSGAGVVYKVLQAYDEKYNNRKGDYKEFEDLAALGIIADAMDSRTLDNNAIIRNGLKNINNPLFQAILEHQAFKLQGKSPNKIAIAFYVAPLINAVVRFGTMDEKYEFFRGFIDINNTEKFTSLSRGKERIETLYQYLARTASNLRNRQNTAKEKSIEFISEKIEKHKLYNNKAIIVKVDASSVSQNLTGLVAMDISKIYNRPTLILRPVLVTENIDGKNVSTVYYRGSGRASVCEGFYSFMDVLKNSGLVEYVEGHDNAFGASVKEDDIPALTEYLNNTLKNVTFAEYNEVDCCITDENWNNICLKEFGEIVDVFGNEIPQPKFHFEFIARNRDFRVQGSKEDSLKIQHNGVGFVTFQNRALVERYLELNEICENEGKEIKVEVIGRAEINEYMGYKNINITMDSIELTICEPKRKALF